jgi:uncharacterized protein YigE (DUF2233 family)
MIKLFITFFLTVGIVYGKPPLRATLVKKEKISTPRYSSVTIKGIQIEYVEFDSRGYFLRVLDQENGPGSLWQDAEQAAKSVNGLAAINAGFFTPDGRPLGIVIADGKKSGFNNSSSLGSGIWFESQGSSSIIRRAKTNFKAQQLIQAGPFLVENAKMVSGLDNDKISARSFVASDGGQNWLIARAAPCSLQKLSQILSSTKLSGITIKSALNFDGGRSAEIYVSSEIKRDGLLNRPIWNNLVRNYVVLQKR